MPLPQLKPQAIHEMNVIRAPDVAPAAAKQAAVPMLGRAPEVLACTSGDLPV